jgi:hypothetical protein
MAVVGPAIRPGAVEDDVDEVVADECGVVVLEYVGVQGAEGGAWAVLHAVSEGRERAEQKHPAGTVKQQFVFGVANEVGHLAHQCGVGDYHAGNGLN